MVKGPEPYATTEEEFYVSGWESCSDKGILLLAEETTCKYQEVQEDL